MQNEQVKHAVSLHRSKGRKESGEYLIEGKRFIREAFQRNARVKIVYFCFAGPTACAKEKEYPKNHLNLESLLKEARGFGIPVEEVSENVIRKMSATEEPQGILAIAGKVEYDWNDLTNGDQTIMLIVDGVRDPGNLGTIIRTALAADVRQIVLTKGTADPFSPKVLRSSMGAVFSQTILVDKTPQELLRFCRQNKYTLAVTTSQGDSIFAEKGGISYPLALVIGSEAFGPAAFFLENADKKYSLPMFNQVESLNAAMAAGIFLFEVRRQARFL